jgi:hypothetical protein
MATISSITVSKDCKTLTVVLEEVVGNITLNYINHITEVEVQSDPLTPSGGIVTWELDSETAGESFNGILEINVEGDTLAGYVVGSCEIRCCIAALVQSAIDCHCHCDKCEEDLRKAEKIRILISGAEHSAYSTSNIVDAVNKYNKAKEFCTAVCACGC